MDLKEQGSIKAYLKSILEEPRNADVPKFSGKDFTLEMDSLSKANSPETALIFDTHGVDQIEVNAVRLDSLQKCSPKLISMAPQP